MTVPKRVLARLHGNGSDSGASILETAALVSIAAIVVIGISSSSIGDTLHDATRKYVCRVEGPDCGSETWVERERPEKPEEYNWTLTASSWDGQVQGSGSAKAAMEFAVAQQGKPYIWGATGRQGYDCSSLMMEAWKEAGVGIPRTTWDQIAALQRVPKSDLKPGDLIFFETMSGPQPTHVGMYLGGGQMVHAGNPVQVVQVLGNPYWEAKWHGQARVPQG